MATEPPRSDAEPLPGRSSGVRQIASLVGAALRKRWGIGLLIFAGLLIEMSFSAAVPMSFKYLVDYAIVPQNQKVLVGVLAVLAGSLVLASAAGLPHIEKTNREWTQIDANFFWNRAKLSIE